MRFHFVRTGGFAGLRLTATIDSDALPEEESEMLMDELDNANFFELPPVLHEPSEGADRFQYEITVEEEEKSHTIAAGEAAVPENLQPLVQHLERLARSSHRRV
jgi:hypothetical protein